MRGMSGFCFQMLKLEVQGPDRKMEYFGSILIDLKNYGIAVLLEFHKMIPIGAKPQRFGPFGISFYKYCYT